MVVSLLNSVVVSDDGCVELTAVFTPVIQVCVIVSGRSGAGQDYCSNVGQCLSGLGCNSTVGRASNIGSWVPCSNPLGNFHWLLSC